MVDCVSLHLFCGECEILKILENKNPSPDWLPDRSERGLYVGFRNEKYRINEMSAPFGKRRLSQFFSYKVTMVVRDYVLSLLFLKFLNLAQFPTANQNWQWDNQSEVNNTYRADGVDGPQEMEWN